MDFFQILMKIYPLKNKIIQIFCRFSFIYTWNGFQLILVLKFVDPVSGEAQSVRLSGPTSNTYSNINPGVRLFTMDATTFDLLDYDQYFFYLGNNAGNQVHILLKEYVLKLKNCMPKNVWNKNVSRK